MTAVAVVSNWKDEKTTVQWYINAHWYASYASEIKSNQLQVLSYLIPFIFNKQSKQHDGINLLSHHVVYFIC